MDEQNEPSPIILSPCSSGRRSNDSKSPEFEFWMVRNPSFPQPDLHSADELFSGGILLPLHHIHHHPPESSGSGQITKSDPKPDPDPSNITAAPASTSSKRWTSIFKKTENAVVVEKGVTVKEKKRDKKNGGPTVSGTELNINIWPFSRSRSAGNGGTRPKLGGNSAETRRKVSSAPCSRSNSAGESKSRKWPNSPSRVAGVHVGKTSPVWKLRRGAAVTSTTVKNSNAKLKNSEKGVRNGENETRRKTSTVAAVHGGVSGGAGGGGMKNKVLSLNVPMCIGYRHHLSCRSNENSAIGIAAAVAGTSGGGGGGGGEVGRGGNFFNIKGLFSKKVY